LKVTVVAVGKTEIITKIASLVADMKAIVKNTIIMLVILSLLSKFAVHLAPPRDIVYRIL
jgi:hypothetical protein